MGRKESHYSGSPQHTLKPCTKTHNYTHWGTTWERLRSFVPHIHVKHHILCSLLFGIKPANHVAFMKAPPQREAEVLHLTIFCTKLVVIFCPFKNFCWFLVYKVGKASNLMFPHIKEWCLPFPHSAVPDWYLWYGGIVVNTVVSVFNAQSGTFLNLYVLSLYSGFLPKSKKEHVCQVGSLCGGASNLQCLWSTLHLIP